MSEAVKTVVLLGGESEEREVSLNSGAAIAEALRSAGIEADTFDWHPSRMREFLALGYENVFIALHGGTGENGAVQAMLEMAGYAYTGVKMREASICMDKCFSKAIVAQLTDVPVPACTTMPVSEARQRLSHNASWDDIVFQMGLPMVVKPARNGSSVGVTLVEDAASMADAVAAACLSPDEVVMFEQYIGGYELTVAVLNGKALGVCQIVPKNKFYDYEAKYCRDDTEYLIPSSLGGAFDKTLCMMAEKVASVLDCTSGVVRIDFLADREQNPYFLEVNTVPGMTSHSLVPKIAQHAGMDFPTLCKEILSMAVACKHVKKD